MLNHGKGKLNDGLMAVKGSLESGQSFVAGNTYKLKDLESGWSGEGPYSGFSDGRYEFKID